MTKLSDTQLLILSAAAKRDDRNVLPLPGSLRGGAATKVIGALTSRGLIAERATDSMVKADPALNRIWRNDGEGRAILLHITHAGLAAIGVETDDALEAANTAERRHRRAQAGRGDGRPPPKPLPRPGRAHRARARSRPGSLPCCAHPMAPAPVSPQCAPSPVVKGLRCGTQKLPLDMPDSDGEEGAKAGYKGG